MPLVLAAAAATTAAAARPRHRPSRSSSASSGGAAQARADLTDQALALYTQKHPNVTFKKTWQGNQGYFDKLATLTAGGDAPDIFQIDDNYLTEYASRSVTLDLTPYQKSGKLDTSKFPESLWKYGLVDGKLAGLSFGENTQGLVFNKTLLQAHSLPEPKTGQSWDGPHRLGGQRHPGRPAPPARMDPSARLQGVLGVAAPAGQGALQRQAARLRPSPT